MVGLIHGPVHQAALPDKALEAQPLLAPQLESVLPLHSLHSGHVFEIQFWDTGHHFLFSQSATFSAGLVLCLDLSCLPFSGLLGCCHHSVLSDLSFLSQTGHGVRGLLRLPPVPTLI